MSVFIKPGRFVTYSKTYLLTTILKQSTLKKDDDDEEKEEMAWYQKKDKDLIWLKIKKKLCDRRMKTINCNIEQDRRRNYMKSEKDEFVW